MEKILNLKYAYKLNCLRIYKNMKQRDFLKANLKNREWSNKLAGIFMKPLRNLLLPVENYLEYF